MKRFASLTKGNIIVVGRKTVATFKNGEPLKDRVNIILTKDKAYKVEGAIIAHSIDEIFEIILKYDKDVYVVGGASVYKQMLPYCNVAYITKFDKEFEADSFIENLDDSHEWILKEEGKWEESESGVRYKFCCYTKL